MAFTEIQTKALKAKLRHRWVRTRESQGSMVSYVEGWHVITEANRIFGFDSWDRQTMSPQLVWSGMQRGEVVCFYSTKVRITVRAGGTTTMREGIGTGLGRSPSPEISHETALKAAETDATKRALATFGNPFGLALYDRNLSQVTKPRAARAGPSSRTDARLLVLSLRDRRELRFATDQEFVAATLREIERLGSVEDLFAFWSANMASLIELYRRSADEASDPTAEIIDALKARSRQVALPSPACATNSAPNSPEASSKDPAALLIPKEKRIRDRTHLEFVARQPCVVCGRRPSHAHHLRFAQPRAMGLKVSDEYTLPLCNIHHDEVHRTGDERAWWARHGIIEPLKYAARLWGMSHQGREPTASGDVFHKDRDRELTPAQGDGANDKPIKSAIMGE